MRTSFPQLVVLLLLAGCAAPSGDDGGGAGGRGGGGAGGHHAEPCPVLPTAAHTVGPAVELEADAPLDVPLAGYGQAIATNGTDHLVVWWSVGALYFTRLGQDGSPLDVPARPLARPSRVRGYAVAWDGAAFLAVWLDGDTFHRAQLSVDGALQELGSTTVPPDPSETQGAQLVIDARGATLLVWTTETGPDPVRPYALLARRLDSDGTSLDAAPILLWDSPSLHHPLVDVVPDGSGFVVAWGWPGGSSELRATRIAADGTVSDPGGVLLAADGGPPALLVDGTELVVAWAAYGLAYATRLSPALVPTLPAPVPIAYVDPDYETLSYVQLSRSTDGHLAIEWQSEDDTWSSTVHVQPLDAELRGVGAAVSHGPEDVLAQRILGIAGSDHLVVRADELLSASRLTGSERGLTAGPDRPIFFGAGAQSAPSLAGNGAGYLALWRQATATGEQVKGRFLDGDGVPTAAAAVELGAESLDPRPNHVAPQGGGYLVARRGPAHAIELTHLSPDTGLAWTAAIDDLQGLRDHGVACVGETCLVAWSRGEEGTDRIYGVRVGPTGAFLDPEPLVFATDSSLPGIQAISVLSTGGSFWLYWNGGATELDAAGNLQPVPGFQPVEPASRLEGLPLAAGKEGVLAVRLRRFGSAPPEQWVEQFRLDGSSAGTTDAGGWLSFSAAATWDGSGYLLADEGDRTYLLDGASPPAAAVVLPVERATEFAIAARSPGRVLRIGTRTAPLLGVERLFVQPLVRPDADVCPVFPP